jgi:hypothetical protein
MEDEPQMLFDILIKYVGIKLFKEDQDKFKKEFFDTLFEPYEPVDYSTRSTMLINAILEEDNLPFVFSVRQDSHNRQYYWILLDLRELK